MPAVIAYFGDKAWILEKAYWPSNHGNRVAISVGVGGCRAMIGCLRCAGNMESRTDGLDSYGFAVFNP